jgi:LEA14-like dessication related protein
MRRMMFFSVLFCIILEISGCGFLERRINIKNCNFSLESVSVKNIGLFGVDFQVRIKVSNPNDVEAILDGFDFDFFINQNQVISGKANNKLTVPPSGSSDLYMTVSAGYDRIAGLINEIKSSSLKTYAFKGTVFINSAIGYFTFPVSFDGKFQ